MATYTVAQLKDYTSVKTVSGWSDDKILLYQGMAETILSSLDLDTTSTGYSDAYNRAVVAVFDWLADNPTGLQSLSAGKVTKDYKDVLPGHIKLILKRALEGEDGFLNPTALERKDIGLR